jgi:hypothetical protein
MEDTLPEQAPLCVACVGDRTNPDGGPCLRCKVTGADPDPLAPTGTGYAAREALAAVLKAIDIPNAATQGEQELRDKILLERVGHAAVMLRGILGEDAHPGIPWSMGYLRARLVEHRATGYMTWQERVTELEAAKVQDGPR